MESKQTPFYFAPELFINKSDLSFYTKAFGATEQMRFSNEDGSIHVAELSIGGSTFHIHEVTARSYLFSPSRHNGTTVCIGLFVDDVDEVMKRAIQAGATLVNAAEDFDYGYRQGTIIDPFGHYWQIQKKI